MANDIFSNSGVHRGAWLVYINGLEIPTTDVTVNYGVWQMPQASFSVPPFRALQRLGAEDKVEVTIFYLDDLADPENPEFKLAFEGEITGWSYVNVPGGRAMRFEAVADISIFNQLYFHFLNTVDAIVGSAVDPSAQANQLAQAGVFYPFSLFKKGLISPDKEQPPDIDRPFELVYNVVKGMLSNKIAPERRTIPAVNYFSRWARKRNFQNRFAALPMFEDEKDGTKGVFPIFEAAQADFALKTVQQNLSATIGNAGNIFQVLQETLGIVYHELAMIPTAPCFRVRLEDGTIIGPASTLPSSPERAAKEPLRLVNYFVKPQMLFGIAPSCNIFFPSMVKSMQYTEDYLNQPTRTYLNDQFLTSMLPQNAFTSAALTVGWPSEVNAVLKQKTGNGDSATAADVVSNGKNVLVWPEEFYKGPVVRTAPMPSWFTYLKNKDPANQVDDSAQTPRLVQLFELYAKYEHLRSRYEKRGGAIDLVFNPYVVPGFPCVAFDERASSFDVAGYVMSVTQMFSHAGMHTSASYSFGRTLSEMMEEMAQDIGRLGVTLGAGPADPIDSVREISQQPDNAEQFYNALFHGRAETPGRKASFDLSEIVGYVKDNPDDYDQTEVDPIVLGTQAVEAGFTNAAGATDNAGTPEVQNNLDGTKDLGPTKGFQEAFADYDVAMRYIARPICTLREYISFIHGGKSLEELIQEGQVSGPDDQFSYAELPTEGEDNTGERFGSAVYFSRIKRLRQGPGERPQPEQTGATVSNSTATPYTGNPSGVSPTFPQTRADWDTVLEAFRDELYNGLAPQR
jgi:hypothetical protein